MYTPESGAGTSGEAPPNEDRRDSLEAILELVRLRGGVDFTCYRRPLVERRVRERMHRAGAESYETYSRILAEEPGEVRELIARLTIKFSSFFRDAGTFDFLRECVLPEVARHAAHRPLSIWSAGCGNGEEAYSLALLLEDGPLPLRMGRPAGGAAREGDSPPGTYAPWVWGTDIDERALDAARAARYAPSALAGVPPHLRRFFAPVVSAGGGGRVHVRHELSPAVRRRAGYLRHDLIGTEEPPVPRPCDLIMCRNVLIYLAPAVQERVTRLLCGSLRPGGYLCLGEAEWPTRESEALLEVAHRRARVFQRR